MTDVLMCGDNPIGQLSDYDAGTLMEASSIAPTETLISTHAYAKDDLLTYNGQLYIATSAIAVGDTITSKIERTTTTSYVNPTRMNHIEDGIESASTATGTEYSSGVSVKQAIDSKANSTRFVTTLLTYDSSTQRFKIPANTPLPPNRLSIVVRNYDTGSYISHDLYVLTVFNDEFVVTSVLQGNAPANGHRVVAQWFSNS